MSRGKPRGSQYFMGSLDSAADYCEWLLCVRNCTSPHAVMAGAGFSFGLAGPAQNPVMSRRGAGPPLPFFESWSTTVFPSSARIGLFGSRVCDHEYEESNSTPARPTKQSLLTFIPSPFMPPQYPAGDFTSTSLLKKHLQA